MTSPDLPPAPLSARELAQALDSARDVIAVLDAACRIRWCSRSLATLLRTTVAELVGRDLVDATSLPSTRPRVREQLEHALTSRSPVVFDTLVAAPAGPRRLELVVTAVGRVPDGVDGLLIVGRDVTAERQQQASAREREEFFRLMFERGPLGIVITSPDRHILRVNQRFAAMLGYKEAEIVALRTDEITHVEDLAHERALAEDLLAGRIESYAIEKRYMRRDGRAIWGRLTRTVVRDADGEIQYMLAEVEDIDERKRAQVERDAIEQRLRERQKLDSLGVLAGGIAHDVSNLLVPILGNAQSLADELTSYSPLGQRAQEIIAAAQRAARLSEQMRAYSGRAPFIAEPVDVSAVVRQSAGLLQASVGRHIQVRVRTDDAAPTIDGDASHIRQLLLNLVQNAAEAARPGHDGHVRVSTGRRSLTHVALESTYVAADLPEGEYVFLQVADDGGGMDPDTQARMFDPFFSTKNTGRGLGLPAVLGIVRGHGGAIHVESTRHVGTTVTVYFPARAGERVAAVPSGPAPPAHASPVDDARGVILVIDADEAVRVLTTRTLERAGYRVIAMPDARAAARAAESGAMTVACALIDVSLVDPNIERDISELTRLTGPVPIVALSAFGGPALSTELASRVTSVLSKPFTPRALRDAIAAATAARP